MAPAEHGTGRDAVAPAPSQGEAGRARTRDGRELYYQWLPGPAGADRARPTVVFEGGLAAGRSSWAGAQAVLADVAPTVVYDRSGLGRSPAAPAGASRRLHALAEDLGDLEDAAGDLRALLENPPGLAGLPVTVVSAGRVSPGMPKSVRERATASHAYRARQSPHGRHVVLPEADHMVLTTSAEEIR